MVKKSSPDMLTIHLGEALRRAREDASLTQGQVGARTGLSVSYICKIESGKSKSIGVEVLLSLCAALQVDAAWVMTTAAVHSKIHLGGDLINEEARLLQCYRSASKDGRRTIAEVAVSIAKSTPLSTPA